MGHPKPMPLHSDDKTVVIGTKTEADFWADLHERTKEQEPPAGAICAEDYARRFGVSHDCAAARLQRAAERGEVATGMFNRRVQTGVLMKTRAVRYWWPNSKSTR